MDRDKKAKVTDEKLLIGFFMPWLCVDSPKSTVQQRIQAF